MAIAAWSPSMRGIQVVQLCVVAPEHVGSPGGAIGVEQLRGQLDQRLDTADAARTRAEGSGLGLAIA
ncbi:hypothetical protein [Dactylosporangium sp. CA-092794]|uniref:hypothetical protein n=1 Tax=Dactylosporangium sp. CA-092794 TaxID=3239929 RepID=UPI003D8FDF01